MKKCKRSLLIVFAVLLLTSCEHNVFMETTVDEDGTLDKVVRYEVTKSVKDIHDLDERHGWKSMKTDSLDSSTVIWQKTFASAKEANEELAVPNDTLFRVTSVFDRKFRWFYTYLYYSDTYHAINRMKLPIDDYVSQEDHAFIDRLPAEGKAISKADSLYLTDLNEKLFNVYGWRAIYEEYYTIQLGFLKKYQVDSKWIDTLASHKENVFGKLISRRVPDDFLLHVMDSLHIPLPYKEISEEYRTLAKAVESKTVFISTANDGKYIHRINMPWNVVHTNADSVVGNHLFWKPPVIKFLIQDYTMYAEARRMNYWAVALSVAIIGLTLYLFLRRRDQHG